ncbi:universal stress protein [Anoxynatronum buryatiense]|uniref:Nucleotide-binding universal stress protein, UspA family n=1 Tax=Anoxynatronum buryatiense TaxID=489973 RepID=A0AA45WTB3_9CLOT|nr:universal stress protein [Anoxynatronum buryatiense]SMP41105.1 Nucleotide-binding universal stress protein, UspA family [Anoxynatronum buryatiense]
MRILVCVDGSKESMKAVVKAVEIASGCRIDHVAVLHVYEKLTMTVVEYADEQYYVQEIKKLEKMNEEMVAHRQKIVEHAAMRFREKGIEAETMLKEGHPSHTISQTAEEGNYDLIILGSRGGGGLKKLLLGSVSNAVIQETSSSVLVVK